MNKMKKITALLLCVIMVVYAPMTAFANSDMIGTDTTILETTTPTDPVVGCTECGGTDAHLETCSQYAAAAVVETATITLDSIPAGAIAENENVQGTKATITANPVSLYSSLDNGAAGVKMSVESGTVIDLIAEYTFTTDAGSQVFYMFDYYGTNKAFGDTAFSNRYISAEEISIQSAEDPGAIVDDVVPDSDVTEIIDPVTGLMVSGDIPADLTLVASPKTLEESGIDTTVYPIDGPSLFYGVNLLQGNTGYMTFFSITVTFPEAAVAECGLTAGDSYNVYSIHDGVTDVTGPFVYSGGNISADFTNLGVMGIAKAAEEGNTPGGDVPEDETLVDLKALHGDAVVSYLDEEIEFQINPGTVTFYDGYESDVHAKETADTAGTEIEAFVEITYADGFVLYQYSYFGEDEAFKELVKYHQFISADDVTEITPEMKQPCAICGFKNCKTAHLYCEECKEFDCGVKHPKPEPIRPITKPELPSVEPEIPEGSDSVIVDAEGNAVTDGIQLYEGERVSFSAWSKLEEEGYVDYQWQICYDKKNDLWTNIQGQDEQGIVMSPAMVESIIDAVGSAVIRCQMTSGDVVQYSETIPVTVESGAGLFAAVKEFFAAPLALAKNAVATVANALTDSADAAENTGVNAVADTPELGKYTIVINYQFENNEIVANPYMATLAAGSDYRATVNHPNVQGYQPSKGDVGNWNDTSVVYSEGAVTLNITDISADIEVTVVYVPAEVNYTVIHYQQNVDNDNYSIAKTETKLGETKSQVPEVAKVYPGFYALLYERPEIAADGSTVVEIYYDRYYYLMTFNLDEGGYGVEPIYAQYGAQVKIDTPTRPGYTFNGWSPDVPSTVPVDGGAYTAKWTANDAVKVSVVFWGENADDEKYSYLTTGELMLKPNTQYTYNGTDQLYLYCDKEPHTHNANCIICGKVEHTLHTEECLGNCTHSSHKYECYSAGEYKLVETSKPNQITDYSAEDIYTYTTTSIWGTITHYYLYVDGHWYCAESGWMGAGGDDTEISLNCNHTHTDSCRTCEEHAHKATCYSCGKEEHIHDSNCTGTVEGLDSTLWTFVESETVTVNPNGSSVINVYYDRTAFTLHFKARSSSSTDIKTITRKWGADIHSEFPIETSSGETILWSVPNRCESFEPGTYLASINRMPAENIIFTKYDEVDAATIYYCIEVLPDEEYEYTNTYNGTTKYFKLYKSVRYTKSGYLTYAEEFHDIQGFKQWDSDPEFTSFDKDGKTNTIRNDNYLYYTRNTFDIVYYNPTTQIATDENIPFEAPLNSYSWTPDSSQAPAQFEPGSVVFEGWYLNPECTGEKFDFTKKIMPSGPNNIDGEVALSLYAKWVPTTHTVEFYLNQDALGAGTKLSTHPDVKVYHGQKVIPVPTEPENGSYTFVGWFYMDNGVEKAFDFANMPIKKDMKVYGKWSSNTLKEYIVYFKDQNTNTEIADRITGSTLAGETKTFDAKGGTDLNAGYQEGYFPLVESHSMTLAIDTPETPGIDEKGTEWVEIIGADGNKKIVQSFTFWYVQKKAVPYTVYYVAETLKDGEVAADYETFTPDGKTYYYIIAETKTDSENRKAVVTEQFKPVTGYMPDAYQKRLVVDGSEGAVNEIIFYYSVDSIHAYYKITHYTQNTDGTNWTEYASSQISGNIGQTCTASPLTIDGFTYDKSITGSNQDDPNVTVDENGVVTGVLTADGLELQLYYVRNEYPYKVRYLDKNGNVLAPEKTTGEDGKLLKGKYGDIVYESVIVIGGYTAVEPTSQSLSIRIEESQTEAKLNIITFYYERALADLTIVKNVEGTMDPNQCFLFTVTKPDGTTIDVVIQGEGRVTIKDLEVGKQYSIKELTDWSWRYTPTGDYTQTVTLDADGSEVTFTNTRSIIYWLSGDCLAENRWDGSNGNTQPLARKEDDEVEA